MPWLSVLMKRITRGRGRVGWEVVEMAVSESRECDREGFGSGSRRDSQVSRGCGEARGRVTSAEQRRVCLSGRKIITQNTVFLQPACILQAWCLKLRGSSGCWGCFWGGLASLGRYSTFGERSCSRRWGKKAPAELGELQASSTRVARGTCKYLSPAKKKKKKKKKKKI